ncbi:MAG: adenylate/guanylate cyclase domain-containing protein [Mariprofundaceae bacterium]|nr:adenylate/guanylate cyclase domain-containing protein [Mariprofundaceae bacterium]
MHLFKTVSLRFNLVTAFVSLLVVTVVVSTMYTYYSHSKAFLEISDDFIDSTMASVQDNTRNYLEPAAMIPNLTSRFAQAGAINIDDVKELESYSIELLKTYPQFTTLLYADEQGNFLMPKRLADGKFETKIINRNVTPATETWIYRDPVEGMHQKVSTTISYDPRGRAWYQQAKIKQSLNWTDVYIFFTSQQLGLTASYPILDQYGQVKAVYGVDMTLTKLSTFLKSLKIGKTGVSFIMNQKGELVAFKDIEKIVKKEAGNFRPATFDELGLNWLTKTVKTYQETSERKFSLEVDGTRYIAAFEPLPTSFAKDWLIGIVVPEDDFIGILKSSNKNMVLISLVLLFLALLVASALSNKISKPMVSLVQAIDKIRGFKLGDAVNVRSPVREIQVMNAAIESMRIGLSDFQKYVPATLVRQLIEEGEEATLGGSKKELTIFFSDIENFTTLSESMDPESLALHISSYFEVLTAIVSSHEGTVDKYIGDAIMAFWGAPLANKYHARGACRTALLCQQSLLKLNQQWVEEGKPAMITRIGLCTGDCVVGNIGSTQRMNYTVLGDTVNLASRLEGVNKVYHTDVLISQSTYLAVKDDFVCRLVDVVAVKGKSQAMKIYELMAEKKKADLTCLQLSYDFNRAMDYYLKQAWVEANMRFIAISHRHSEDTLSAMYVARCQQYQEKPPAVDWDGVMYLTEK